MTAVEAIITLALFAVIATLLVGVFTRSLRISTRESVNLELEQSCHFLARQLEEDLTSSGISGISYLDTPEWHGVGINPIEDVTSEGTLAWQGTQILYFWEQRAESVYKQNLTTSTDPLANPIRFTPEALLGLAGGSLKERATIGEGVKVFLVTNRRADGTSRLVDVSVELERNLPNDEPRRFRLDCLMTILN
jgi:hypothetical protein